MNNRPVFEAEHNKICSYPDIPILDFYKGYYECVYIILSPFVLVQNNNRTSKSISWQDFVKISGLKDINELDIALRNSISGLKEEHLNKDNLLKFHEACQKHEIIPPIEGEFPETLIKDILKSILEQNHPVMFVADEHGFERKLVYVEEFLDDPKKAELNYAGHENWYTNKNEILYTTHWDSFYTLLCSDRKTVESIVSEHKFEGFFCDHKTEIYWSVQ